MADYIFTDLKKSGQRAVWATWAYAGAQVTFSFVHIYQNIVINRFLDGTAGVAELEQSDSVVIATSIGFLVILVAALCVNGRFLYLASRNAAAINDDPKMITPGWAVGWYFVPIANLWMPFKAMKQTWSRLIPSEAPPAWLGLWWFSWIGMSIFDRLLGRMPEPRELPEYIDYNTLFIISGFLWLIPAYFFARIVRTLAQTEHNPAEVFA
ncbi:DUF4328 domain-containing protein [Yoonia sp. GPGPB17]|uniref:DUF4328 domain-containing protein n=1 Tax=Yoonia sp. GPGPB17 TaxID=3026147 RepID=UPI0030BF53DC